MARRVGGRAAKRAGKTQHEAASVKAVRGGQYKPLSDADVSKIHDAALEILETVGMAGATDEVRALAVESGCIASAGGRLQFPRSWIDDLIAAMPKQITLCGRTEALDVQLGVGQTHFATGGMAVQMVDLDTGDYRASTLKDLYDCARVVNALENIQVFNRTCVPSDISNPREFDLAIAYACVAGTTKPLGIGFSHPAHVGECREMFDVILGGDGRFADRPFATCNTCAVVPPLTYGEENTVVALQAARLGFPVKMVNAAQAGATAPAALAGTLAQTVAETLAGMALVQLAKAGAPVIWANWPFVSDLRTGAFTGGGGEITVLNAASAQIARWYGFPNSVAGGMTDAKEMDAQYGYEKGMTDLAAGLAGADVIYESVGMIGSIIGCALENFVLDNEMLGAARQTIKGIEINDETLSVDVIRDVCTMGQGHYLDHAQTLELMKTEYRYPTLASRETVEAWDEAGRPSLREGAKVRAREILAAAEPQISKEMEDKISARLPVHRVHHG
jgi:trimethylamine--corrinoid protein Co-methyltransferase